MSKKNIFVFLISIISVFTSSVGTYAAPDESDTSASDSIYMENSELKEPDIEATAAILTDVKTGRVLYSKNPQKKIYPASTTKIMTGILALEHGNLSDVVTANLSALAPITNEDSHMGILIGEQLTLEQLINGMLVYSANDAANVIATHLGGTPENFVQQMNEKALALGANNTNFVNAYGIHDDNHYTTAEDMVIIARYAMQNEKFREIVKTPIYKIAPTEKYTSERNLPNTNLFLSSYRSADFYDKSVTGVKTGSTNAAGYCLVTTAEKNGTELLSVVFKAPNKSASYEDTKKLLKLGFENYTYTPIAISGNTIQESDKVYEAKDATRVALTVKEDVYALLPKDIDVTTDLEITSDLPKVIKAPIKKGEVLGTITYSYNGSELQTQDLIAANDVERDNIIFLYHIIINTLTHPLFYIPVILIIILIMISRANRRKQEALKRKRRLENARRNANAKNPDPTRPRPSRYQENTTSKNPNSRYKR